MFQASQATPAYCSSNLHNVFIAVLCHWFGLPCQQLRGLQAHARASTHGYMDTCIHLCLLFFRAKVSRTDQPQSHPLSPELLQVINSLVTNQQQQQTPLWNTLSLQMAQNRQLAESLMTLPKLIVEATSSSQKPEQSQGLKELPDTNAHGLHDHGTAQHGNSGNHANNYDNVTDDELEFDNISNLDSEEDFEEYSNFPELSQPLTLVEKLEKLYDRLPRLQRPPPASVQAAASVREIPEIQGRVRSLPAPPFILDAFQKFRSSYRKTEGTSLVVDETTGAKVAMVEEADYTKKKTALNIATKKSDLQFQIHDSPYPQFTKLDTDYTKLFRSGSGDNYHMSRKQINNLQTAASFALDACSHMDALLWGVKECLEVTIYNLKDYDYESEEEFERTVAELREAQEYLQSLGFCEEFIIKKNVWIFSSLAAFMRESMLYNTSHIIDDQFVPQLRNSPFNAGKLYNK